MDKTKQKWIKNPAYEALERAPYVFSGWLHGCPIYSVPDKAQQELLALPDSDPNALRIIERLIAGEMRRVIVNASSLVHTNNVPSNSHPA